MNKSQLVEAIANETGLTKADSERALSSVISTVTNSVNSGQKVMLPGLGSFEKVQRAARAGVNPATGDKIQIAAKNAPKFKAAKAFKDLVA